MENKIIDTINVSDEIGPNGLVIITDKSGKILVRKHNMVVSDGKKAVFNNLLAVDNWESVRRKLYKIYFGNSMNETVYEYSDIDKIVGDSDSVFYSYEADKSMTKNGSEPHPYISFNLNGIICDASVTPYLSCLSLTTKPVITKGEESSDSDELLFSRIKFDPIPMVDGNQLNLIYYIYF